MILGFEEFKKASPYNANTISALQKRDKNLHEMTVEEIKDYLKKDGRRGFTLKKSAICTYLKWLYKEYGVDVVELNFEISNIGCSDLEYEDMYFYSLDDLFKGVEICFAEAELTMEKTDFDGFKVFCLLQWYGVTMDEFISIKLNDVKYNKIFIPLTNRTIVIDDKTADIIDEYKRKTGEVRTKKLLEYKQDTLYRTVSSSEIDRRTIENIKYKFAKACGDPRFAKKRIYNSGKYYLLLELENKLKRNIGLSDNDLISQIYGKTPHMWSLITDFNEYKSSRDEWLKSQIK